MQHLRVSITVLSILVLGSTTVAAAPRTFVSAGTGSDSNPCSRPAPCRNFAAALAVTDSAGEVIVLDSGGYGPMTIAQPVSIISPSGVYAGITASTGDAISITATGAVRLHGLSLTGLGGNDGVRVHTAVSMYIENLSASGFNFEGVNYTGTGHLSVKDSAFRNNSDSGVLIAAGGASTAGIDNCIFEKNSFAGFESSVNSKSVVRNSIALGNLYGYYCSGTGVQMTVENSISAFGPFNSAGVIANNAAQARVSNCTLTNHSNGLQNYGNTATVLSRGNNTIADNASNTTGAMGTYSGQ